MPTHVISNLEYLVGPAAGLRNSALRAEYKKGIVFRCPVGSVNLLTVTDSIGDNPAYCA